jgi:hypothetical protein
MVCLSVKRLKPKDYQIQVEKCVGDLRKEGIKNNTEKG